MANENDEVLEEELEDEESEEETDENDEELDEEEESDEEDEDFDDDEAQEEESNEDEEEHQEEEDNKKEKPKQNKNANRYFKNQRLQKEALEEAERKAYEKGLVEAVNGINPYTDEEIKDDADIQEYLTMREIEKAGKDPVADYHKWVKDNTRKEVNEKQAKAKVDDFIAKDREDFAKEFPDVDMSTLMNDSDFIDLFGDDLGEKPLASLYKKYKAFVDKAESKAKENAENQKIKQKAKEKSSVGNAGKGKGTQQKSFMDMTDEEFIELQKQQKGDFF